MSKYRYVVEQTTSVCLKTKRSQFLSKFIEYPVPHPTSFLAYTDTFMFDNLILYSSNLPPLLSNPNSARLLQMPCERIISFQVTRLSFSPLSYRVSDNTSVLPPFFHRLSICPQVTPFFYQSQFDFIFVTSKIVVSVM